MKFHSKTKVAFFMALMLIEFSTVGLAYANKSSVRIEAPTEAQAGETIIIAFYVTHSGNNLFHHTNWVVVRING